MKYSITLIFIVVFVPCIAQLIKLDASQIHPVNISVTPTTYKGKTALKVIGTDYENQELGVLRNTNFKNGTIEIDVSGNVLPNVDSTFRGFVGIAFRIQERDTFKYECFFLRPLNARVSNQLRRNHTLQYISFPDYPWYKLRSESPGVYESYADMVAGEWTHLKIVVEGNRAFLFINNSSQPSLIVNDLKLPEASGSIGLWIGAGTEAYFSNLKISKQ